jgi:hypothetical protein
VDCNGCDVGISTSEFGGKEDVGEFGLTVSRPGVVAGHVCLAYFRNKASRTRGESVDVTADINDADVGVGFCCCFGEGGQQLFGQECVSLLIP